MSRLHSALQYGPMRGETVDMEDGDQKVGRVGMYPWLWEVRFKARTPQVQETKEDTRMIRTAMATLKS